VPDSAIRILIVEDNPADARLLEILLRARFPSSVSTARATSRQQAVEMLGASDPRFDVVLLDPGLPDASGLDALTHVRRAAPGTAVVLLSGVSDERLGMEAVREGAQDYLVKGRIDADALSRAVRYAVERQRASETISRQGVQTNLAELGAHMVLWEWNLATDEVTTTGRYRDAFGIDGLDDLPVAASFWPRIHPDDLAGLERAITRSRECGQDYRVEFRFLHSDGRAAWCESYARPMRDGTGAISRFLGVTTNIDRRKRAEQAMRSVVAATASVTGQEFFPRLAREMATALGTTWAGVMELDPDRSGWARTLASWFNGAPAPPMSYALDGTPCQIALRDQECFHPSGVAALYPTDTILQDMGAEAYAARFITDSKGARRGLIAVVHDSPLPLGEDEVLPLLRVFASRAGAELERIRAEEALLDREEQLRQSQRLESVGRLASGMAHEFNNLLTAIRGYVSLAGASLPPGHAALTSLARVEEAAAQATAVAGSLQTFGKRGPIVKSPTKLRNTLESAARLFRRMQADNTGVEMDLPAGDGPWASADDGLLQQALLNLLLNAREAAGEGGRVRLSLTSQGDGTARIRISDSGPGMSPDVRRQAMEPFFTTRNDRGAAGLGLSVVHGIVTEHDGRISIESTPGRGTMVEISLPTLDVPAAPAPGDGAPASQGGLALLIEPNQLVRGLLASMLEALGYRVADASGPDECGAELSPASPPELIVGGSLTEAGWRQVLGAARRVAPNVLAIGVVSRETPVEAFGAMGIHVLYKPFQITDLRQSIRALNGARSVGAGA